MSTPSAINGKEIFELLHDDLLAIEVEFGQDTVSDVSAITEIGEYLREGGGKRIRPALLLLAAKLFNYRGTGAVRLGAVVEIIHTATLVHDDIIDEAQTRRGRPAANTRWGNSKCVLAGDWLYMQSFKIAVQERNFRVLDTLIELTQQMVEGELLQMEKLGKLITLEEHFDLIFRKTACLFSVCMRLGAILGGASPEQEEAAGSYGRNLGMAFQIVDDVLDLTASESVLGKPVASDLREGKVTMAVIHALERCTPQEREKIATVLRDRAFNGVTHADILAILNRYGALEAANARAAEYAEAARSGFCCRAREIANLKPQKTPRTAAENAENCVEGLTQPGNELHS
ncbi:MAG: polyprenyl synthetase family protein [Acidobacteria bacterium]|nr:MAG: polyprenyl synthetase family protein [Acidobacteriota bacterium]